jgi:PAS domain S-box-containing protein
MSSVPPHKRVAIYQSDELGRCVYVNAALCEMFELTRKEALGEGWMSKVHPDDHRRVAAARKHAISPIPVFHLDYRLRLAAARTIWVAAFSTALMSGTVFTVGTNCLDCGKRQRRC